MQRPRSFTLPADVTLDRVTSALRERFSLCLAPPTIRGRRYYDSFDGRLYNAGGTLFINGTNGRHQVRWERLDDEHPLHLLRLDDVPRFPDALPDAAFRDDLASVLKLRALLPLANVQYREHVLAVLNDDDKTVARFILQENITVTEPGSEEPATLGTVVRVLLVKGYPDAFTSACTFLRDDLGLPERPRHPLTEALQALGRPPGHPAARLVVTLDPELRTDEAAKELLRALLRTLEANEPGLRGDLDTEFLHQYRIAVRRTRSILGQLRKVFPPEVRDHFRPAFKWLGSLTGPTRDLDVYLLRFDAYRAWLPEPIRDDLEPLRFFLKARQRSTHARLVEALDTPRYRRLLADWRAYLEAPVPHPPPSAQAVLPVSHVASRRIWRAYRKVLTEGRAILDDPDAPAEALHRLRISCKRLRYLMELFASLYPARQIRRLIRALKRLQDNLGDFQDFAVQQNKMQQFALEMMNDGFASPETMLAMGRLEAYLEALQRRARGDFAARFSRFARKKNRKRFTRLFKKTRQPDPTA